MTSTETVLTDSDVRLETRAFQFRAEAIDVDKREIVGIAVPYGPTANIAGLYEERFAQDAVQDSDDALLFYRHGEPIGKAIEAKQIEGGWQVRAKVSDTAQGRDALTLARDGVVTQLSVGFEPGGEYTTENRRDALPLITRTRVRVREVSLVPFGAYADQASITEVRERTTEHKENTVTDAATITAPPAAPAVADQTITELRAQVDELERRAASFMLRDDAPVVDTRSAAAVLKAIASGDENELRAYNDLIARAYTGGTTADTVVKAGWVGDLTRIFDTSSGVLASIFGTGTLPASGMSVEFGELKTNTVTVGTQANEGDDLPYGKVQLQTRTAPVQTAGGYSQLSRQEIERSTLPVLQRTLDALAIAAGAHLKGQLRTAFGTAVTGQAANSVILGATLAAATYNNFVSAIVDAAVKYDGLNLPIDSLIVSASVFKKLASLNGSDGRPMLSLDGSGANTVGRLNITALNGSLAGTPVVLDAGQSGDLATFVNGSAITVYTSPVVSLQDDNIVNLSKTFSVYRYFAIAPEVPTGIVPLKLAAS